MRYLTGYVGSNGIAVIGVDGRVLFTDSRYAVSATEQVRGAEVVDRHARPAGRRRRVGRPASSGGRADRRRGRRPHARPPRAPDRAARGRRDRADPRASWRSCARSRTPTRSPRCARPPRWSTARSRRVLDAGIVGRTERAVAFALHGAMLDEGAQEPSFATIVASGPRGARPHHVPGPGPDPGRHARGDRHGRGGRRLLLGHDPHRRPPGRCRRASRRSTRCASRPRRRRWRRAARGHDRRRSRRRGPRARSSRPGTVSTSGTGSGTASAS